MTENHRVPPQWRERRDGIIGIEILASQSLAPPNQQTRTPSSRVNGVPIMRSNHMIRRIAKSYMDTSSNPSKAGKSRLNLRISRKTIRVGAKTKRRRFRSLNQKPLKEKSKLIQRKPQYTISTSKANQLMKNHLRTGDEWK